MTHPVEHSPAVLPPARPGLLSRGVIPLLLIAAVLATYWPILHNDFVGIDDATTVYENQLIRHLTLRGFCSFWTSPQNGLYAPLTYSLFAAISLVAHKHSWNGDPHASPFEAWPFHAASLLLHVLAVLVVYQLLRRLIDRRWPAAAGALLFALHPVQVETVAWITEINGLLCGFLSLLAVLLYVRSVARRGRDCAPGGMLPYGRERWSWFFLATEVFVLAILAKPLGVVVPLLAAVILWMEQRRSGATGAALVPSPLYSGERVRVRGGSDELHSPSPQPSPLSTGEREQKAGSGPRVPWELALWFLIAALMAVVAHRSQPVPQWWVDVPPRIRPLIAADALAFYIYKLLLPITLVPDYDRSPHQVQTIGWTYTTWIVPVMFACLILFVWRRKRVDSILAGALWFIAALLPVLGLITFAFQRWSTVADRYLYLPMFGVALCAAGLLDRALRSHSRLLKKGPMILAVIVLIALGVRTRLQTRYWHDTKSLFGHTRQEIGREPAGHPG